MQLRQVALVASDLESTIEDICAVLGVAVAYRDPGVGTFGLENALFAIGGTFLEIVSPKTPDTTAGRLLDRRGGDGGYMVILQTDDLLADRKRLADLGVRVVWEIDLEDIASMHLHPKDVGGAILSLDVAEPPSSWRWAGPDWKAYRRTESSEWIIGAEIQMQDPRAAALRWAEIVGYPVIDPDDGSFEIPLDAGCLRFVSDEDGRGDGMSGLELKVRDRAHILSNARGRGLEVEDDGFSVCGTRIRLSEES